MRDDMARKLCNNSVVSQAVWHVPLSCWNHKSISTSSLLSQMTIIKPKITVHHFSIALTVHCNSTTTSTLNKYGPITLRYQNPHQKVTFCRYITFSWVTWGFWSLQMRQFYLFTNPFRWKSASSVNIIFFEKSPSFWLFSNKIKTPLIILWLQFLGQFHLTSMQMQIFL